MTTYSAIKGFCDYTSTLFFRDFQVIGLENVPDSGPLIVYGNHNNQFVDGVLLLSALKRKISFIAAAMSMRRKIIGPMLKASGAIPVERPQDVATKGAGLIVKLENNRLFGQNTEFTKIKEKSTIKIDKLNLKVKEVINDTQLLIEERGLEKHQSHHKLHSIMLNSSYEIIPHLEYEELYENVWTALKEQKCIGIFPEGGSHDRLRLLPLKGGICIMALGAMDKYGCPVTLVPAGFNYYNQQKFRSKVILEFGPPYRVPQQLVQLYRAHHHQAISTLLNQVEKVRMMVSQMLAAVTTTGKTFEDLSTLFACRELYTRNLKKQLTSKQKLELNRRFALGFDKLVDEPKFKKVYQRLKQLNEYAKLNGLSLKQQSKNSLFSDICQFLFYFARFSLRLVFALPGIVLMSPVTTLITYQAEIERRKAVKKSSVKDQGNDVVASTKILLSMIYFPIVTAIHTLISYKIMKKYTDFSKQKRIKICILIVLLMPLYAMALVKSYDSLGRSLSKLKFLFIRIFKRSVYNQFNQQKKELSRTIKKMVDQYGGEVIENFQEKRIVRHQELGQSSHVVTD